MRLTGGHHPKREAGASLTSPTAPAPTLSRLPLLLFLLQHFPLSTLFARSLSVLVSSPPFTDVLLATPTQPQVVPGFISRELPVSLQPAVALSKHCICRSTILIFSPFSFFFFFFFSFSFSFSFLFVSFLLFPRSEQPSGALFIFPSFTFFARFLITNRAGDTPSDKGDALGRALVTTIHAELINKNAIIIITEIQIFGFRKHHTQS